MRFRQLTAIVVGVLLAVPALAAGPALDTEDQKTVYAVGLSVAQNLQPLTLSAAELEIVMAGITDGLAEGKAKLDVNQYRAKIQQFAQQRSTAAADVEKKAAVPFLEKFEKENGAEKTASGLIYIPIKAGTGESPKATDTVKVHYHGTLRDGSVFDSSVDRGEPAMFPLNRVIPCWTEGLQKMKVGGKAKLVCPSSIAYGDRGMGKIRPGSALVFEVELLTIEAPDVKPH